MWHFYLECFSGLFKMHKVFLLGIRTSIKVIFTIIMKTFLTISHRFMALHRIWRIFIGIILFMILIRIITNYFYKSELDEEYIKTSSLDLCMVDRQKTFVNKFSDINAVKFSGVNDDYEPQYLSFTGNGYIGCSWQGSGQLLIKHQRSLSMIIDYYPLLIVDLPFYYYKKETFVQDLSDGIMYKHQCFKKEALCISSGTMVYAHRSRPGLLQQNIRIYNPTAKSVDFNLKKAGVSLWSDAFQRTFKIRLKKPSSDSTVTKTYSMLSGILPIVGFDNIQTGRFLVIAIAEPIFPSSITVPKGETMTLTYTTAVYYTSQTLTQSEASDPKLRVEVEGRVLQIIQDAVEIREDLLRKEHISIWNKLWASGVSISPSLAPDTLNGDRINTTLFYLLCQSPAPLHLYNASSREVEETNAKLRHTDRCYDGHDTLHVPNLWYKPNNVMALSKLVKTWFITLEKNGCDELLDAGADGVMQAVLLSAGSFSHSGEHLEFGMLPSDLHRELVFRRLHYRGSPDSWIQVEVTLDVDNRALMRVSSGGAAVVYHACDAGCLDSPVKLSKSPVQIPIKVTHPRTAILYLTDNLNHLKELKMAIHVAKIEEAPAHRHEVIALHRHGHPFGGLPTLFWVSLFTLVMLFHLFLCKLIFNEYCRGESTLIPPPPPQSTYVFQRRQYSRPINTRYVV